MNSGRNPFANESDDGARTRLIEFHFSEINEWLQRADPENFDPFFFESVQEQWNARGELSDKQAQALENIYEKWVNQ